MGKRKAITKKTRFEVFKRDKFRCQYCGSSAPEVVLEIDHMMPVSKGGHNDIMNLITSCKACNAGKRHRELSDDSVITKQKQQLEELQERREQIKLMTQWREELLKQQTELSDSVERIIQKFLMTANKELTDYGKEIIRGWLYKFPYNVIVDAVQDAMSQYPLSDTGWKGWEMVPKIAYMKDLKTKDPSLATALFFKNIIIKRYGNCAKYDSYALVGLMKEIIEKGKEREVRAAINRSPIGFYIGSEDYDALIKDFHALNNGEKTNA